MELMDIILKRRSVRKYKEEAIPDEKLKKVIQAGLAAPSSRNLKPWEFYVIRDKEVLKKLSKAKAAGGAFLEGAGAAIVVAVNEKKADTWAEDDSIAMSFMHLMATEQGLGSCWIQIHLRKTFLGKDAEENVRSILGLEEHDRIAGILALGVPEDDSVPHTLEELDEGKIHWI